jgi:hypothetical protein
LSFNPPKLLESLLERIRAESRIRVALRDAHQHTNTSQSSASLRPHRNWPRRRTTNKRNELPSPHLTPQAEGHLQQKQMYHIERWPCLA